MFDVYCINLDRRPDRWKTIAARFAAAGLAARRISAVDATDPQAQPMLASLATTGPVGTLGTGTLACTASHIKVWTEMLTAEQDWALVTEDDAVLHPDTGKILAELVPHLTPDHGLVKIERFGAVADGLMTSAPFVILKDGSTLHRVVQLATGSAAYLLHKNTACQLLDRVRHIAVPVDHFLFYPLDRQGFAGVPVHLLAPMLVRQDDGDTSDISPLRGRAPSLAGALRRGYYEARTAPSLLGAFLRGYRVRKFGMRP